MWLAYTTGLRAGELAALRIEDVGLDAGTVRVRSSVTEVEGVLDETEGKTRRASRVVPVPSSVMAMLRQLATGRDGSERVFTSPTGRALRMGNFRSRYYNDARARAGVADVVDLHALRHGAITNWARDRYAESIWELQAWAGHASISTTQRYFGHFYDETSGDKVAGLDSMIVGADNVVPMTSREAS